MEQIINKRYKGPVYVYIMKQSNYFAYCQTVFPKVAFLSFLDNTNFVWNLVVLWEVSLRLDFISTFYMFLHTFIQTHFLRHISIQPDLLMHIRTQRPLYRELSFHTILCIQTSHKQLRGHALSHHHWIGSPCPRLGLTLHLT